MKKLPWLLVGYFLIVHPFSGQEKTPVPPPTALCTAGVPTTECKEITEYLGLVQQGALPTRLIQFVVADAAAYKAEKDRALTITGNSPLLERPFLFSAMDSFYKVRETAGGSLLERVYFNESSSCHAPVIEPGGKMSDTKFGDYDSLHCDASLDYTLGFIEGSFQGANNATNWLHCALDKSQQDGKACGKR
jgi:hypothetical protein